MKHRAFIPTDAEMILAGKIEEHRVRLGLSKMQLAKKLKVTEAQIVRYETGGLVPLGTIETLGELFTGDRIQKKTIRRISFLRKREKDHGVEEMELHDIYQELFALDEYIYSEEE